MKKNAEIRTAATAVGAKVETSSAYYVRLALPNKSKVDLYRTQRGWIVATGPRPDLRKGAAGVFIAALPHRDRFFVTPADAIASLAPAPLVASSGWKKWLAFLPFLTLRAC